MLVLTFCAMFFSINGNSQQVVTQVITHESPSNACSSGTYKVSLIVSYISGKGGLGYSVISSPSTNLPAGNSDQLAVVVPVNATILSKRIKIDSDNGTIIWNLDSDSEQHIYHPSGYNWLNNCSSPDTDYLFVQDYNDSFSFNYTSVIGG